LQTILGTLGMSATSSRPGWLWWRIRYNENWQKEPKYSEKTCPSAILSTTNPTWPDPGANPGRHGGKPSNNRLSYGAALRASVTIIIKNKCNLSMYILRKNEIYFANNFLNLHIGGGGGGVHTGSTRHVGHFWPGPSYCEDGELGGIKIGRWNQSTWRKPAPASLCLPKIPPDQTRARTRAAAVGSQPLTAWAMSTLLCK
jgi:hypothetical protein